MKRWLMIAAPALLAVAAQAFAAEDLTFEGLWQIATSKADQRTIDEGRAIRVEIPSEQTIYFFSKPGQPEHPAVFKRSVVQESSGVFIRTEGWPFGDTSEHAAFEKILAQFRAQDDQMRQRFKQNKP